MGKTSIEWTDASWNPIVGCTEVSPGCANCYAARLAATRLRHTAQYKGLAMIRPSTIRDAEKIGELEEKAVPRWTGGVRFLPDRLEEPLRWKKPRRIFVCDMGDLFHESVEDDWLVSIFAVMWQRPQHTFQVLTKRPKRMLQWFTKYRHGIRAWAGVSVENQHFAEERIPLLLGTPAAVRWISAEPLLGPIQLLTFIHPPWNPYGTGIDWVVCGGESGPNARRMHPDWARALRDQCQAAGVPFFFKQWGEWFPNGQDRATDLPLGRAGQYPVTNIGDQLFVKMGKRLAGRLLDGREWSEFPR